jgi:isopentenyl phosphate kinase
MELVLVKLGGSLITNKGQRESLRRAVLERLAEEIAPFAGGRNPRLLVGHGGGSFGHAAAARFRLRAGKLRSQQYRGVSITQDRMGALHRQVIRALHEAGAMPFSLAPSSFLTAEAGRPRSFGLQPLVLALERGFLPVVFGDTLMDRRWGACICSTETVFLALTRALLRRGAIIPRILWCGDTAGIYDAGGRTIPRIGREELRALVGRVGGSRGVDVTGGMAHRLRTAGELARLGVASWVLDGRVPGRLGRALAGESVPGTRIEPAPARGI